MSNELVKQTSQLPSMDMAEMQTMAKLFAESGMFPNVNSMAKAFIKMQAGKELGIAPFAAMAGIHIIKEKAQIGAGLMAGKIKSSGKYDYKVVELTNETCILDFYEAGKKSGTETFTIADAKKAGTQNTDKFPKNMLFARAISNGIKFYCPDLYTMPVYTPEEMSTVVTEDIAHEEVKPEVPVAPAKKQKATAVAIKAAIERIEAGELGIADKMKETFDLTAAQIKELEAAKPKAWELTPDQQKQAQSLMDSSTMDTARREACAIAIATCTTQGGYDAIISELHKLQSA